MHTMFETYADENGKLSLDVIDALESKSTISIAGTNVCISEIDKISSGRIFGFMKEYSVAVLFNGTQQKKRLRQISINKSDNYQGGHKTRAGLVLETIESFMKLPRHSNIVRVEYLFYYFTENCVNIYYLEPFYKHAVLGDVSSDIRRGLKQLLCGVAHLHTNGFIHRNIRNDLMYVNNEGELMISLCSVCGRMYEEEGIMTPRIGTESSWAPEMKSEEKKPGNYGTNVDVWSLGICYILLCGYVIYPGLSSLEEEEVQEETLKIYEHLKINVDANMAEIICEFMIQRDPKRRMEAQQLLTLAYFNQ